MQSNLRIELEKGFLPRVNHQDIKKKNYVSIRYTKNILNKILALKIRFMIPMISLSKPKPPNSLSFFAVIGEICLNKIVDRKSSNISKYTDAWFLMLLNSNSNY